MKKIKTIQELQHALNIVKQLQKISRSLNNSFTADCNFGNDPKRTKRQDNLIIKAKNLAANLDLVLFVQGDPRGTSLYLLESDKDAPHYSTRGLALY